MREADRRTMPQGTPARVLMERAGTKVVEFLESEFSPLVAAAGGDFLRLREQRRRRAGGGKAAEDAGGELAGGAGRLTRRGRSIARRRSSSMRCSVRGFASRWRGVTRS